MQNSPLRDHILQKTGIDIHQLVEEQQAKREKARLQAEEMLAKIRSRASAQAEKKKEDYHAFS